MKNTCTYIVQVRPESRVRLRDRGFQFGWHRYQASSWAEAWAQVHKDPLPKGFTFDDLEMARFQGNQAATEWRPENRPPLEEVC